MYKIQNFKYIWVGYKININIIYYIQIINDIIQVLLFLFFLHLIRYSHMSHYDYIYFSIPYVSSGFCFIYLCLFVVRCLMAYDISLLCELHFLS